MHRDAEQDRVVQVLLAERTNGLRRLVWSLVRDDGITEDVLQDTFVAAVEKPPRDPEAARSWLTTVARNFVRLRFREESRRAKREARSARPIAIESHEASIEGGELREIVAECAATVPEPYGSTLFEIYYRGVSAKALARTLGVPESTVRVRKKRGLEFLQRELDRRVPGGRRQWIAGAVVWMGTDPGAFEFALCDDPDLVAGAEPTPPASATSPPATRPTTTVGSRGGVAVLTVALIAVILWMGGAFEGSQPEVAESDSAVTKAPRVEPARDESTRAGASSDERSSARSIASVVPSLSNATIRVVDRDHTAIEGAAVFTGALPVPSERRSLGKSATEFLMLPFADDPLGVTNRDGELEVPWEVLARQRLVVRAAGHREHRERPRLRFTSEDQREYRLVLEPSVQSVVQVTNAEGDPLPAVPVTFVGSSGDAWPAETDPAGRVVHRGVDPNYVVRVRAPGCVPHVRLLRAPEHRVTLVEGRVAQGRWVSPDGGALVGATVEITVAGHTSLPILATTDAQGRFATPPLPATGRVQLTIRDEAYPAFETAVALPWTGERTFTAPSGVWVTGRIDRSLRDDFPSLRVALAPLGASGSRQFASVDSEGRFRLGPVVPGEWAWVAEGSGERVFEVRRLGELAAGTHDLGVIEADEGLTLEGRVTTPTGDPVSGVVLQLGSVVGDDVHGPVVTTDREGRFLARGLASDPPEVLDRRDDGRWNALGRRGARKRGWIVTVVSPHQLLTCNETEIPRAALYGSRNSARVDPRRRTAVLVVDGESQAVTPKWALRNRDGVPVRTTTNLVVIPRAEPSARSVIFAGTDGVPAVHLDSHAWRESLIAVWTREYAVPFFLPPIDGTTMPVLLEERRKRAVRFENEDHAPWTAGAVFVEPVIDQRGTGVAILVGTTGAEGRLDLSGIASGTYRLRTWAPEYEGEKKLGSPIATIVGIDATVELGSISWEIEQEGEWTLRVGEDAKSSAAARWGSR